MSTPLIQKIVKLANKTFAGHGKDHHHQLHEIDRNFANNLIKLKCLLNNLRLSDVISQTELLKYDNNASQSKLSFFRRLFSRGGGNRSSRNVDDDEDETGSAAADAVAGGSVAGRAYRRSAPVAYTEIFENGAVTIGMFALKSAGVRIPLHDHPGMHGLIKVVHGVVTVDSYSPMMMIDASSSPAKRRRAEHNTSDRRIPVERLAPVMLDSSSEPCCLSPEFGNYHEIVAVDGPAAFVDILSPPYDHYESAPQRECHFYRCVEETGNDDFSEKTVVEAGNVATDLFLIECGQPIDFWSDNVPYSGPKLQYETFDENLL